MQFKPRKGDYAGNLTRIGRVLAEVGHMDPPPQVVVFPETAASGYFLEGGVRDVAVTGGQMFEDLAAVHREAAAPAMDVVIGFYEEYRRAYHNSAMYAELGGDQEGIRHIHRKVFLPTYGVFDEARFVRRAHRVEAFDTQWGRAAILICEDAWHSVAASVAALDGAEVLFIPSASPARGVVPARVVEQRADDPTIPRSLERWERLARTMAGEHGVFVALAQLVGFEGGKGFPGVSMLSGPTGDLLSRGPLFSEGIVTATCDLTAVTRARADAPLLTDLRSELPHLVRPLLDRRRRPPLRYDAARTPPVTAKVEPSPALPVVVPPPPSDPLAIDPELVRRWLTAFLRDEVVTRRGFQRVLVGLSGGVDSTLTAFLAADALGPDHVIGVRMPYATSSRESLDHAELVTSTLGIEQVTVDITAAVDGYAEELADRPDPARMGNIMARTRMITLFDLSAARQALPLGTGNKSERLFGYFTWHADDSPPVNPLGDLFKTQVWALARFVGVPEAIVSKPATADLVQGQTDEEDLGVPYAVADPILFHLLGGRRPEEIVALGFGAEEVETVNRRLNATHWKRRLPTVAMLSHTAIGEYYLRPVDY